jgi:isopentenyl-diphosphate delta-isomerase
MVEAAPPMVEEVVLVDRAGRARGTMAKLDAHRAPGALHRAFSAFLFRPDGHLLLQRRAADKYHFRGRWSNTCCSHPRPGESPTHAGRRRLREELGLSAPLVEAGAFTYVAADPLSALVEREYDHVLVGWLDWAAAAAEPAPDPAEVDDCRWVGVADLRAALVRRPHLFTPWLPQALPLAVARCAGGGLGCSAG